MLVSSDDDVTIKYQQLLSNIQDKNFDYQHTALIIVDPQNDFCEGGSLAITGGKQAIAVANKVAKFVKEHAGLVIATQDWHPEGHISFASTHRKQPFEQGIIDAKEQVLWPDHCVQRSPGAEVAPELDLRHIHQIVQKGMGQHESYSAFIDETGNKASNLADLLFLQKINTILVCGLATDCCVKKTALDATDSYQTYFLKNASEGVSSEGSNQAILAMKDKGIQIL